VAPSWELPKLYLHLLTYISRWICYGRKPTTSADHKDDDEKSKTVDAKEEDKEEDKKEESK
jgi:hypothetical protein